jgi:hypothetical protein
VLDQPPYNLEKGELVVARVSAPAHGVVVPSEPNTEGAKVAGLPDLPENFKATATSDEIELTWSASEGAYTYELYLEIEGKYEKLTETPLVTFRLKT